MKRSSALGMALALAALLSACGGGGGGNGGSGGIGGIGGIGTGAGTSPPADTTPKVAVDDLPAGSYTVAVGDANAPTVGKYFAGADGSRLLALTDDSSRLSQLYRRAAGAQWVGVPPPSKDVNVALLISHGLTDAGSVDAGSLAGSYVTRVAAGVPATFTLGAGGDIVAGATACKLSGKVSAGNLPRTLKLNLTTSGCGPLPAAGTGVLVVDADDAPARFRLVADNGAQTIDLWAFAE